MNAPMVAKINWVRLKLGDIAVVQRGKFSARPRNQPRFFGGEIPFIQTGDVARSNGRVTTYSQTLSEEGLAVSKRFPSGSLAIAIAANIGDIAQIDFEFACPDSLVVISPHSGVDIDWLRFCIASKQRDLESLAPQNAQKNLNLDVLKPFLLDVPPFGEQIRIGAVLSIWDTAIEKVARLISANGRALAAVAHQLLTARKRLKGFAADWQYMRADRIFDNVSIKGAGNEPLLSVTQDRGVIPRDMLTGRVTMPSSGTDGFKLVEPGNFVISLRSFQGGLEHSAYRGLVSPAYTVLVAKRKIDAEYFRHYFRSADFIKRLSVAVIGIRDGKQISFEDFCSIKLPFPTLEEQRAITEVLDTAENEIALLRMQLASLRQQKRGLMQKLLTGQWRIKTPKSEAA